MASCENGIVRAFSFNYENLVNEMQYYVESSWSTSTIEVAHRPFYQEVVELGQAHGIEIRLNGRLKAGLILASRVLKPVGSARAYRSAVVAPETVARGFLEASGFSRDQIQLILHFFRGQP